MRMIKDYGTTEPPSTSPRSSCFSGCFGCSGRKMQIDEVNSGSRRRLIKKPATKTVPVELNTPVTTSNTTWEIQVEKSHAPATESEQTTRRKKWLDLVKRQKTQNGSFRSRRKETKAAVIIDNTAGVDSPVKKSLTISHPVVSSVMKPLTVSTSSPPTGKKQPHAPPVGGGDDEKALDKTTPLGGGFDSIIGMSVILVTLVIMVLWGKICAILCTSAWFFIAPRLVAAVEHSGSAVATADARRPEFNSNLDLESVEYKKKVVLEGLLQRNHRNVVGRL